MSEIKFGIIYFPSDSVKSAFEAWKELIPESDDAVLSELERIEMEIKSLQKSVATCYIKSGDEVLSVAEKLSDHFRDGDAITFEIENGGRLARNIRRCR